MKKRNIFFFLALLCLIGKDLYGQKVAGHPPVPSGAEGAPVVVYGEIINPDSLGPLTFRVYPYGKNTGLEKESIEIATTHGTFFDGVLDPRVRKFHASLNFSSAFAYMDLYLGDRPILSDYLILKTDSIKISIDLQSFQIVFGGPNHKWFKIQQNIQDEIATEQFDSPRALVEQDREQLLNRSDHRRQFERNESIFGARILILEQGKDAVDYSLNKLEKKIGTDIPGFAALSEGKPNLSKLQYSLLLSEVMGKFYGGHLSTTRRFDLLVSQRSGDKDVVEKLNPRLPVILSDLSEQFKAVDLSLPTSGMLLFFSEWAQTTALLTDKSFREVVISQYKDPIRERLLAEYALNRMASQDDPISYASEFLPYISSDPWKSKLEEKRDNFSLGVPLIDVQFTDLKGNTIGLDEFKGRTSLVYFYFSSCSHSARYFREFLFPLYQELEPSYNISLVAVSVDNDEHLWRNSISEYSNPTLTNLNLPAQDWEDWLDHYLIESYPRIMLLDERGHLLSLRLRENTYERLKEKVTSILEEQNKSSKIFNAE